MDYDFNTNDIEDEFMEDCDEKLSDDNSDNDSISVKDINEVEQILSENESELESESDEESENEETINLPPKTYIPDGSKTEDLIVDESAYILLCKSKTSYPCMSFDIIPDNLGEGEDRSNSFPVSMSLVGGTYSGKKKTDSLILMKFSKLNQDSKNSKPENLITETNNKDKKGATLRYVKIPHKGCVNRLRNKNINGEIYCSTWSENGNIYLWNLNKPLKAISNDKLMNNFSSSSVEPIFVFKEHNQEGFAMDWSSISDGNLATGDMNGKIHVMKPGNNNDWIVNNRPLVGHSSSVEDIQWSPTEQSILASCSADKSIRIWDLRNENSSMIKINEAHNKDVNVISWNKLDHPFLLSGGDDGLIKVWDLRMLQSSSRPSPIATFSHHTKPITSLEWNPNDSSSFIASSEDDQLTIWDLSVERDVESNLSNEENDELKKLPPQLLFIHQGQKEIKEIHWHNQLPGYIISTSLTGFDIFRTISF